MRKPLSVVCCVLFMHTVSQPTFDIKLVSARASGEKVLIKALTAIVNREGNKKIPVKRPQMFAHSC